MKTLQTDSTHGHPAGSDLPAGVPPAVLRIWWTRERTELEAADHFSRLAHALATHYGKEDAVAKMATKAALDEQRHATLCRKILNTSVQPLERAVPQLGARLGPISLNQKQRVLYACVALSCVTETLSTALLIEIRSKAHPGIIHQTVHTIVEDEIQHGRLGWAELARQSQNLDLRWLSGYLGPMLKEAIASDVRPMLPASEAKMDLSGWGILSPYLARKLLLQAVHEIIFPGLRAFGVNTEAGESSLRALVQEFPK